MHGINSLQTCMLPRQMGDAAHLGFYTGAFNGCVYIGSALSTYVFAQVSETFGWNGTVLVWCVTAGLGALLCLLLSLRREELHKTETPAPTAVGAGADLTYRT